MAVTSHIEERIPPVRGLILLHNRAGEAYPLTLLKKWVNTLTRVAQVEKADAWAGSTGLRSGSTGLQNGFDVLRALLDFTEVDRIRLSLRTDCVASPECLPDLKAAGLFDVFLTPLVPDAPQLQDWLEAAKACDLSARVQVQAPFEDYYDVEVQADLLEDAASVNIALHDPFQVNPKERHQKNNAPILAKMNALCHALAERGVEVNLLHVPFSLVEEDNLAHAVNWPQFFLDHQQYQWKSYQIARELFELPPHRAEKLLEIELGQQTSFHNRIDGLVRPWLLEHPALYVRIWALHKLTRHLRFLKRRPAPLPETVSDAEAYIETEQVKRLKALDAVARECRYHRISDYDSPELQRELPEIALHPVAGEVIVDPLQYLRDQPKYYDSLDQARLATLKAKESLAESANRVVQFDAPTEEVAAESIEIEGHMSQAMPGALRWFSFANTEIESTPLGQLTPPFTVAYTVAGGIASQAGFSMGRHAKVVCPMIDYTHTLVLHVAEDGEYVLLRDGQAVTPTAFEDACEVPLRIGDLVEPRISLWNIDGQIVTQGVRIWEGSKQDTTMKAEFSVVIVSTCFSRRLEATLLSLVHQQDFDLAHMEVLVGYVPGIDPTDDVLDSLARVHPDLRIVRMPFGEGQRKSKGLMINECVRLAQGDAVMLLDSDIMLPPTFLLAWDAAKEKAMFIAPDGRKMLDAETTAKILLGALKPWEDYAALLDGEGELRLRESDGIPIGYCQCVKREVLETVPYAELDHFEGSDWLFASQALEQFGKEKRLDGLTVLHLDHGGSQWYGTNQQR